MFRKVFTGLRRITPFLQLQSTVNALPLSSLQLQSTVNALPQRNLFTSPVAFAYDKDVDSIKFFSQNKKFFVDIKEADGPSGKYLKISELSNNRRSTVKIENEDVYDVLKELIKMEASTGKMQVSLDSKSPKRKAYELEITTFGSRENLDRSKLDEDAPQYKTWSISEHHHTGEKYRIYVPNEVWTQMIQNISILIKEHIPE